MAYTLFKLLVGVLPWDTQEVKEDPASQLATVLEAKQEVRSNQTLKSVPCLLMELWVYACQLGPKDSPDSALWMAVFSPLPTQFSPFLFSPETVMYVAMAVDIL